MLYFEIASINIPSPSVCARTFCCIPCRRLTNSTALCLFIFMKYISLLLLHHQVLCWLLLVIHVYVGD